ncbi:MAG TPA: LamG-like jellyroll fold domain-containing protein [Verrucomicrobiae bacterium]
MVVILARALIVAGFLLCAGRLLAQDPGGTNSGGFYTPLETWSFYNYTNWTSDHGHAPIAFTNLAYSELGNGSSLVVDTNIPAWLNYRVHESDGTTNLTVDSGTVMFWFAPGNWSSTNAGGGGPGVYGRLFEAGSYTADSSYGWWSIYVDPAGTNIYFSAQTNNLSSTFTNYLSAPISWTTNYFHFVALTYSATNTSLYLDGNLAASGAGVTVYPNTNVLAKGFYIGSDSNGVNQAHGLFNNVATYSVPLDAGTIQNYFSSRIMSYIINPWNFVMFTITPYSGNPSGTLPYVSSSPSYFDVISGAGYLQYLGQSATCVSSGNIWITNVYLGKGLPPITFNFDIVGGASGSMYDVFAAPALASPASNGNWTWLGQGGTCSSYAIPALPTSGNVFFILGTPLDSDGDGLTDAYELLVSHTNPYLADTDGNGMPDGWQVLHFGKAGNDPNGDPDHDALRNLQEYLYGTDPQVSEGFSIWTTGGNSSIP